MALGSRSNGRSLVALALLAAVPCTPSDDEPRDGRLRVVASFYPLAEAARRIGDSCVDVVDLTPPGVEPHDLELSPDALEAIVTADVDLLKLARVK